MQGWRSRRSSRWSSSTRWAAAGRCRWIRSTRMSCARSGSRSPTTASTRASRSSSTCNPCNLRTAIKLTLWTHQLFSSINVSSIFIFVIYVIILIRVDKNADGHITEAEVKEVNNSSSLCLVFHLRFFFVLFLLSRLGIFSYNYLGVFW